MTQRVDAAGTWSWTYQGSSSRILFESLSSVSFVLSVVNSSTMRSELALKPAGVIWTLMAGSTT
ncbi:MAG: hypothetical protein E4H02_09125 [Lentisphaerales bacterium]|nr:MAG: hypothetical protein E4H02_09125 [Lentisphaerales bacterium]